MIEFLEAGLGALDDTGGDVVLFLPEGKDIPDAAGEALSALLSRVFETGGFTGKAGTSLDLRFPQGLKADRLLLVGAGAADKIDATAARDAGGRACAALGKGDTATVFLGLLADHAAEVALGMRLRAYRFDSYLSKKADAPRALTLALPDAAAARAALPAQEARAAGVEFTRDLVNEPANILNPREFANRLESLRDHGVEVEVLDEAAMTELGMHCMLAVGQGSENPSYMVAMRWNGGKEGEAPIAYVGKGVTFDTGGISIKPAGGMEEMTMDMGGAGVVSGVMKSLALRKAPVNVVGVVGLVENMPDGKAQRPGDIVRTMSGQTVEVINTDAEGRLVLADVLWYTQDRFKPSKMINLATLTGAIIIALGHENAGYFSNDDDLAEGLASAAKAAGEGVWRLPLAKAYDDLLKSRLADMKNVGGRSAGSITAAQFLQRFVNDTPWAHIDIAGVALGKEDRPSCPRGASGWGVLTLDRFADG